MSMVKVNVNNVWRLTTRAGEDYYVKCPSKSGAKIYLANQIGLGGDQRVVEAEISSAESALEAEKPLLQAEFLSPDDERNWTEEGRV